MLRRQAARSAPWPPAFMRTAPPIEPGTPTAHSKPVRPAATRAPGDDRQGGGAAGDDVGAVDLDPGEALAQGDGQAGEAGVGHEEVRALADDEDRDAGGACDRRRGGPEVGRSSASRNKARRPPTR